TSKQNKSNESLPSHREESKNRHPTQGEHLREQQGGRRGAVRLQVCRCWICFVRRTNRRKPPTQTKPDQPYGASFHSGPCKNKKMSESRRHKNHYMKASPSSGEGFWKKAGILAEHIRSRGEITITEMRKVGVRNWSEVHTGKFNEE